MEISIATVVAALVNMVIGMLWYSPLLFGKLWMKASGKEEKDMKKGSGMGKVYAMAFVGSFIMAFVLSRFIAISSAKTIQDGALVGFWAWLGFIIPVSLSGYLFEGKSRNLTLINGGYYLVVLMVMGAILSFWG